jgi:hypothetical protein
LSRCAAFYLFRFRIGRIPHSSLERGADITSRQRPEWDLYCPLVEEGLHFLVDVEIVLALRGGTQVYIWQGKRRGRGEVSAEAFHGL